MAAMIAAAPILGHDRHETRAAPRAGVRLSARGSVMEKAPLFDRNQLVLDNVRQPEPRERPRGEARGPAKPWPGSQPNSRSARHAGDEAIDRAEESARVGGMADSTQAKSVPLRELRHVLRPKVMQVAGKV